MMASIDLFGSATTSLMRECTSGLARDAGTGVTSPIHKLESPGVRTGILIIHRRLKPEILAKVCIIPS